MVDQPRPLSLPLKVPLARERDSGSIRSALSQINSQRQSFRHVTEESLKAEIAASDPANNDTDMEDGQQDGRGDAADDRNKKAEQAREEMLKLSAIARIEAFSALEFLSFLLSKYNPAQAKTSLSTESREKFKQLGTVEAKSVARREPPADTKRTNEDVSRGYKMDAFHSSSENLLHASSRLRKDATAETRYWEGLMSLKAKGWAVSRVPGRKDIWAVHFGSAESRPMFRDRGIATLNKATDGDLWLDFGGLQLVSKSVKVRIVDRNNRTISTTRLNTTSTADTENELQRQVLQARNTLFEEELFLEIHREATALASYNVKTKPGIVVCPLGQDYEACISLVNLDDAEEIESEMSSPQVNKDLDADRIALVLRLLLSYAHRQNLKRRSQPPPPMTLRQRSIPEYHLIRPVLAYYEHKSILHRISNLLSNLASPCGIAGIPFSFQGSFLDHITLPGSSSSASAIDNWLNGLVSEPLTTAVLFQLPSSQKFEIRIRTQAATPIFGTDFAVISPLPRYNFQPPNRGAPRLSNFQELETFLIQSLSRDVLAWTQSHSHPTPLKGLKIRPSAVEIDADEGAMDVDADSLSPSTVATPTSIQWEVLDAVDMLLASNPIRYNLGLQIQPKHVQCQLQMLRPDDLEQKPEARQIYRWSSVPSNDGNREDKLEMLGKKGRQALRTKTFLEVVADFASEA